MFGTKALLTACIVASYAAESVLSAGLPVFFFHGATGNHTNGDNIGTALKADGRTYVPLTFCEKECSVFNSIEDQIQLAIKQIRNYVTGNSTFEKGYHFLAHSQGGSVARGVIEEMDDHNVQTFVSLAGDGNGCFYGPQVSDATPLQVLLQALGPFALESSDFDFAPYAADSTSWNGKVQRDFTKLTVTRADLQAKNAIVNTYRPPLKGAEWDNWLKIDPFLPKVNNLEVCTTTTCENGQARRKANFARLKAAHFFASPSDDVQSPWQTSILGKYSEVNSVDEIEAKFNQLKVVSMKDTDEYKKDLYGLKTLDKAGRLHLHAIDGIGHNCWLFDYVPLGQTKTCLFEPNFRKNVYPALA